MSKLLYFLPGAPGIRVDGPTLERYGLRELFRGAVVVPVACAAGPAGEGAGLLVGEQCELEAGRLRLDPEAQRWARRLDGRAWTGSWPRASGPGPDLHGPPTPEELLRPDAVGGHPVTLADRQRWIVPVARLWPAGTMLPEVLAMRPDGELDRRLDPAWQWLWDAACRLWEAQGALPEPELFRIAAGALALNYRLGLDECNLLGLLRSDNLAAACGAVLDTPSIKALAEDLLPKKADAGQGPASAPGPSSTGSGPADSCPVTAQPSPTSNGSSGAEPCRA